MTDASTYPPIDSVHLFVLEWVARPPLAPKEGWISDGRHVLHFQPLRYDRWRQTLEVTFGEWIPGEAAPLLKRRKQLNRDAAIKLWAEKRKQGWSICSPQWKPPPPLKPPAPRQQQVDPWWRATTQPGALGFGALPTQP